MRIRQRRRIRWSGVVTSPAASRPNHRWSMDFVSVCVSTGKVIRMLTIVDVHLGALPGSNRPLNLCDFSPALPSSPANVVRFSIAGGNGPYLHHASVPTAPKRFI